MISMPAIMIVAIVTFHLVCIAWVFFRSPTVANGGWIVKQLLVPNATWITFQPPAVVYLAVSAMALAAALLVAGRGVQQQVPAWAWGACAGIMLFLTMVTWGDANEFIYFQF